MSSDDEVSNSEFSTSDSDDEDIRSDSPSIQVAQPPEVLEPSLPIQKCPGVPTLMRHKGFRLCGDNFDMNICTRLMRLDRRNRSLHYFHFYGVENRVDFVDLCDLTPDNSTITDIRSVAESLLPSSNDDAVLKRNISILISRVLCENLSFFKKCFGDQVEKHIQHRYYEQMSSKSVVVSDIITMLRLFTTVTNDRDQ